MKLFSLLGPIAALFKSMGDRLTSGPQEVVYAIHHLANGGGTELQFVLLLEGLRERGISCIALIAGQCEAGSAQSYLQRLKDKKIPVIRLGAFVDRKGRTPFLNRFLLRLIYKILGVKVLHGFKPSSALFIPPAQQLGMKIIYHETANPRKDSPYWSPLIPFLDSLDHVVSVNSSSLTGLREVLGYSGPGTILFPLIEALPQNLKYQMKASEEFHVIYFGRLHRLKGLDHLIRAFSQAAQKNHALRLTLIGSGPEENHLKLLSESLNVADKINFTGHLNRAIFLEELSRADVFCLPSLSEGTPCSMLEAMSIGLPVIATRVGGIPEWIIHQETGWLVPPADVDALAGAIQRVAADLALRDHFSEQSRLKYDEKSAPFLAFKALIELYRAE